MLPSSGEQSLYLLLRKLERIVPLSDEEVRAVEDLPITIRDVSARQDIMWEADRPYRACLVLDGWMYSYKLIQGGRRQILSLHVAGDIPDLQSLRLKVADFSLGALTKATVALIPHQSLQVLTLRHASLAVAFWHLTLIEAAVFREWMTGLGRRSAPERLAHLLCELYVKQRAVDLADADGCPLPLTQTDMGDVLGVTPIHINRVLKELREKDLVTLKGRRLSIHDWARLSSFADFDPAYLHLEEVEPS